jgi:hypothetical protein
VVDGIVENKLDARCGIDSLHLADA